MEITERCFPSPNVLLEVKDIFKSFKKVTKEFYFLRIFWKFQIQHDSDNTFVSILVHKAPVNYPRFRFSVTSGWFNQRDSSLFEKNVVRTTTETLIEEGDLRLLIWANNLTSYVSMIGGSPAYFLCSIQVLEGLSNIHEVYEERMPLITPSSVRSLTGNLKSLLDASTVTDVVLKCDHKCIPVHKCILSCRSPIFKSMFEDNSKVSEQGIVEIKDVAPTVFQKLIDYVYTGNVDMNDESVERIYDLLKAADKFCLQPLKESCLNFIKESLRPDNVCDVLLMCYLDECLDLKSYIISYIANSKSFLQSLEWQTFSQENVKIALDVLSHYVKISELRS